MFGLASFASSSTMTLARFPVAYQLPVGFFWLQAYETQDGEYGVSIVPDLRHEHSARESAHQ